LKNPDVEQISSGSIEGFDKFNRIFKTLYTLYTTKKETPTDFLTNSSTNYCKEILPRSKIQKKRIKLI
jgi:hypothetical protein